MAWKTFDRYGNLLLSGSGSQPCAPVTIEDAVTKITITTVPAGGLYEVYQFSGIKDSGPPYETSIITT